MDTTLTALRYDAAGGGLEEVKTVPALPDGFTGASTCADIHVCPDGAFLYASNRGHDSIVIYQIEPDTGRLDYVAHQPSGQTVDVPTPVCVKVQSL